MSDFIDAGVVLSIASSKTKAGVMYRIEVEDLDTGDTAWYGLGKDKPDFGEDSEVSFEYEETDGGYLNIFADSIEVLKEVKPTRGGGRGRGSDDDSGSSRGGRGGSRGSSRGGSSRGNSRSSGGRNQGGRSGGSDRSSGRGNSGSKGSSGGGKEKVDWEAKDRRIELMSARNSALEFIKIAVEAGAITLPKTKGKGYDALEGFVNEQTARFLEQNEAYMSGGIEAITDGAGAGDGDDEE